MRVSLFADSPLEGWPSMERYARSLFRALKEVAPEEDLRLLIPPAPPAGFRGRLFILWRMAAYPLWARRHQGDVNHVLDHSYGHLLLGLDGSRTVVTVHDIAPLLFPGKRWGFSGLAWGIAWRATKRARLLLADSGFIARELERDTTLPIRAVPLGVEPSFRPLSLETRKAFRKRLGLPNEPFLLHVGHTQPRKNLEGLLTALSLLRQRGIQPLLVQVGGSPTQAQRALVEKLGLQESVRFMGRVSEEELVALYNLAAVLVLPSLYEGFGFPVLEAMACGTPVVAANVASLPEVVGDAGLLVNPRDPEAISEAIACVLDDLALAEDLRRRGLEQARLFTWERTAKETLSVYRSLYRELHG